ncbi:unnamed protein product [Plutella xylostella]|uniref:RING-type E3 ubiquitin transferase n=1 Tax=Plutella xylostella TaxID=51655 RepID=A0A8S4F2W6_PLUXY|nr:unnamed protein product [Plutella xylostella]
MSSQRRPSSPSLLDSPSPPASPDPAPANDSETYTQGAPEINHASAFSIHLGYLDIQPMDEPPDDVASEDSNSNPLRLQRYVVNEESNSALSVTESESSNAFPTVDIPGNANAVWNSEDSNSNANRELRVCESEDSNEPPAKMRKISTQSQEEQDGETCPICLDAWGNSGDHRLVALKCGHLFGSKCVERWLRAQAQKDRSCPTCKSKATVRDLRFIYARRLVAADTAEITALQKQVEVIQSEKIRAELELQKSKMAHRACIQQLEVLRNTLASSSQSCQRFERKGWRFALEKNLEVCKDGGCRVLSYNCRTYDLYVSQKSTNSLFPGFGVRRVSCVDYKLGPFLFLHPKPIRDIAYSQPKDLLLSVSLDGSARLVERGSASLTIQCGAPLWSCTWDALRHHELFVGGVGGAIMHYDIRNTGSPLHRLSAPSDMTPVASLCSTEYGLLSCQLNSSWLWSPSTSGQWEPKALPVDGPFLSMAYDSETHRGLISCRPKGIERSRLVVAKFRSSTLGEALCETEQTFMGSARATLMSRATWVRAPGALWVAAHSESDSALLLHGLEGSRTMSLPAAEPALDVFSAQLNGDTIVAALSESRLRMYKAVPTNL